MSYLELLFRTIVRGAMKGSETKRQSPAIAGMAGPGNSSVVRGVGYFTIFTAGGTQVPSMIEGAVSWGQ